MTLHHFTWNMKSVSLSCKGSNKCVHIFNDIKPKTILKAIKYSKKNKKSSLFNQNIQDRVTGFLLCD